MYSFLAGVVLAVALAVVSGFAINAGALGTAEAFYTRHTNPHSGVE